MPSPESAPHSSGRRRQDVRWRAVALTAILVAFGGLLLSFYDKLPQATDRLRAAVHTDSRQRLEIEQRFQQGVAMLHTRQYEYAMTAFHRVLQLDPKMPEAHVNLGFALLGLNEYAAARDFFNTAIELRSNQLNAYFGLAEALDALGDSFGAMQAMETYVHLAPKDDPFRRKAESAAWELREKLDKQKQAVAAAPAGNRPAPGPGGKP
ncbi:MAG TPA: tetratricopeptide repeat protein [Rhodocyclaceae bacterium]|nr:tetratricopeptide repeat protein [Rhodocyclaceae bacterium]